MESESVFCCRGEEKQGRKRGGKFGEGKGDKYLEKENIFFGGGEEEQKRRKRKLFGEKNNGDAD